MSLQHLNLDVDPADVLRIVNVAPKHEDGRVRYKDLIDILEVRSVLVSILLFESCSVA
jgi:hypothetical protein